jgi:hypothetical protein
MFGAQAVWSVSTAIGLDFSKAVVTVSGGLVHFSGAAANASSQCSGSAVFGSLIGDSIASQISVDAGVCV